MKQPNINKLQEIAAKAIRNDFDEYVYTSLECIDNALECGLYELANEMANDYLSKANYIDESIFKRHYLAYYRAGNEYIFRVFDEYVRRVIFNNIKWAGRGSNLVPILANTPVLEGEVNIIGVPQLS